MRAILKAIDFVCDVGGVVAAMAAAALAVMLIVEVALTSFAGISQPWAVEYSGYLLAVILFAGSGWTLRRGGHIRVNAVIGQLPSNAQRWLDIAASTFAIGLFLYVAIAVTGNAWRSFELGSTSYYPTRTPIFYPQAILAASFWLLLLAFVARVARLLTGQPPDAEASASLSAPPPDKPA